MVKLVSPLEVQDLRPLPEILNQNPHFNKIFKPLRGLANLSEFSRAVWQEGRGFGVKQVGFRGLLAGLDGHSGILRPSQNCWEG